MSYLKNPGPKYTVAFAKELQNRKDAKLEQAKKDGVELVYSYENTLEDIRGIRKGGEDTAKESLEEQERKGFFKIDEKEFPRSSPRTGDIKVTIISPPPNPAIKDAERPCIIFLHGGAFAGSSRHVGPHMNAKRWVKELSAVIFSVEYERTPDASGDDLARDCYEAMLWVWNNSGYEFDTRKVILYGASAGGTLACGAAFMNIDSEDSNKPELCGLYLEAAPLNPRCDSESMKRLDEPCPYLNLKECEGMWKPIILPEKNEEGKDDKEGKGGKEGIKYHKYIAPIDATDEEIAQLPPIAADVGDMDPTCADLISFMRRYGMPDLPDGTDTEIVVRFKNKERKDCEFRLVKGAPHGYWAILPEEKVSKDFQDNRVRWMKKRFAAAEKQEA
ncbi:Esterase lipase thioesterase [Apiospora marii]|uniref:Esterase lipase thioesterase n=1 Tax=Apiospora marii TaxID=335849 RepID=A0ABR1R9G1_9PEZI